MSAAKDRLASDLTTSMKARDELRTATLRMALAAVKDAEVAGSAARELSDDEVEAVLSREAKKRREAAEAFQGAGRPELAARERAEGEVLAGYLPQQLSDEDLAALVERVLAAGGWQGRSAMGQAMRAVSAEVAGRAEGGRVAALVRARLGA